MLLRAIARSPWIRVLRIEFQGDNFLTWFSATAAALIAGADLEPRYFVLGLVTLILSQAALELLDGYHDFEQGAHGRKNEGDPTWTGGSGVLAEGALSPEKVRSAAWICGLSAVVLFVILTIGRTGIAGLVIGAIGAFCGAGWAMPPFKLSYRGLGEAAQAIVAGPLMAAMAWTVAAGHFDARSLAIGLPFGFFELAMALAHNLVDADSDARVGKRTLVVRIGRGPAALLFGAAISAAFVSIVVLMLTGLLPIGGAIGITLVPYARGCARLVLQAASNSGARAELERDFPPYRLLILTGFLLVMDLFTTAAARDLPHAFFVNMAFLVCCAPVAVVLLAKWSR